MHPRPRGVAAEQVSCVLRSLFHSQSLQRLEKLWRTRGDTRKGSARHCGAMELWTVGVSALVFGSQVFGAWVGLGLGSLLSQSPGGWFCFFLQVTTHK